MLFSFLGGQFSLKPVISRVLRTTEQVLVKLLRDQCIYFVSTYRLVVTISYMQVACPMCQRLYPRNVIDRHASTCDGVPETRAKRRNRSSQAVDSQLQDDSTQVIIDQREDTADAGIFAISPTVSPQETAASRIRYVVDFSGR
jgi:mRNA degradation ribonuclease J1/J2